MKRGFTLLEVLVALMVVAVALMAALRAAGTLSNSARDLRLRTLALWSAENRLSQIRIESDRAWPELGRYTNACPQGGIALRCDEEIFSTPNPYFRRVEIKVYGPEADSPRLANLTGFATRLPGARP